MKVCLAEEMRNIDRLASDRYGILSIVLMENAAISCLDSFEPFERIVVVCGKGNNAGDGLAIARHLINKGKKVSVFLVFGEDFKGDALVNYNILKNMNVEIYDCNDPIFDVELMLSDCICDAVFGTGIKGEIQSPAKNVIEKINNYSKHTVSIDIPSGVNADTGEVLTVAVRADKTVTFEAYKRGHILFPGADYAGEIEVTDISIPKEALQDISVDTIEEEYIKKIMPKRRDNSQKGDYGKVLVVGGTKGMAGAVSLAARGAFRAGVGLVTACVPYELNDIIQTSVPEAMVFAADFKNEQERIVKKIKDFDAILFGNGIGREDYIGELLEKIIKNATCPVVIDADGLFALKDRLDILNSAKSQIIITPHSMEFARLLNVGAEDVEKDRIGLSCEFVTKYPVTLVLKGNHTIITTPEKMQYINMTGNSGMATAGSGDALAGIILGFSPRCDNLCDAGAIGVYLHGLAGDYAKGRLCIDSITASDIIEAIPYIFPVENNNII